MDASIPEDSLSTAPVSSFLILNVRLMRKDEADEERRNQ